MLINPLIEQGKKNGLQRGEKIGLQKSIVRLLSRRFQQIPENLQQKIFSLTDTQKLEMLFDASFETESLDEFTQNGFCEDWGE